MKLVLLLLALPLAAAPILNNTGSVAVYCYFDRQTNQDPTEPLVVQASGPSASVTCPAGYLGGAANGTANNLSVAGGASGYVTGAVWNFSSSLQDTIAEQGGNGPGAEQFDITLVWSGVNYPGGANVTANLTYNGQVVWSDIEQAHAAQAVVPQTVVATVAVPFTYGAPFDYEATVSVYGGGIGAGPNYQYSWARAILGVTLTAVPEPGSLLIVFAALFGMGLYKKAS